ncbi:MAG: ABC transporter permease [Lachnospiraceae bacterium]|nr:ABC transporter permease [Lachnospiraceae bacterium]
MTKYMVKRVILAVVSIIIVTLITFFVMNLIPGGPFSSEKAPSQAVLDALNKRYNLDKPLGQQYLLYMKNLLHGDWGVDMKNGRDISHDMFSKFAISAKLGGIAMIIALIVGVVLGSIAALNRNKMSDRIIIFFTTLGTAMPSFILATFLLLVFCVQLGLFPVYSDNPSLVLPIISLAVYPTAYITRLTKTSMLDALSQDYIRTARAQGVSKNKVIFVHALKNGLIPVVTYLGPQIAYIITGSMVVETIFTVPGLGTYFVKAITDRNYSVIMATTIFLAILMIVANLITDIVYKLIDPRITFD